MSTEQGVVVHICRGTGTLYQARVRGAGTRKYHLIGKPHKSYAKALRDLAVAFGGGGWARGHVIMTSNYYDPEIIVEMFAR